MIHRLAIGLMLILIGLLLQAQRYPYNQFTTLDGLPSNSVRSSLIDSRNWFWVGTDAGIVRYKNGGFISDPRLDTLNGMQVWAIAEDNNNNLWFGTYGNGLARFSGDSLVWFNSHNSALPNDYVRILKFLPENKQMLIGGKEMFAIYEGTELTNLNLPPLNFSRQFVDFVEVNDTVYGLCGDVNSFITYLPAEKKIISSPRSIYKEKRAWSGIVTTSNEIYFGFDRDSYYYKSADKEYVKKGIGQVFEWFEDPEGNVWAAAWKAEGPGGLFRFRKGEMIHFSKYLGIDEINGWGLEYDYTNQCLWFLSLDKGLIQIPLQIFEYADLPDSSAESNVNSIDADATGKIWISMNDKILNYDGQNFKRIYDSLFIMSMLKTQYENFDKWYGIHGKSASIFTRQKELFEKESHLNELNYYYKLKLLLKNSDEENIDELVFGPNGYSELKRRLIQKMETPIKQFDPIEYYTIIPLDLNKLIVVNNLGTFSFDSGTHQVKYINPTSLENVARHYDTLYYSFRHNVDIIQLYFKGDSLLWAPLMSGQDYPDVAKFIVASKSDAGRVWYASRFNGLYTYKNNRYTHLNKLYPGLGLNFTSLAFDGDSLVFAGASDGVVYVFTNGPEEPVLRKKISPADGLEGRAIQWLQNDRQGFLWAGTNNALNRIDLKALYHNKTHEIQQFGKQHGYRAFEVKKSAVDSNGKIWIDNGTELLAINTVFANKTEINHHEVKLYKIDLFLKPFDWTKETHTEAWTGLPDKAVFSHDQNYFTFHFTSSNRINPQNDLYSYRLSGLDSSWSAPATENKAVFTNLDPGKYKLEVRICKPTYDLQHMFSYSFIIRKPWWQQWWFISLYSFTGLAMLFIGMNMRVRYVRSQQKRKYEVQQQLAELKLSALQAQMNPHFVFNVLSAIQNAILKNEIDNAIRYLSDVSRLIRRTLDYASEKYINLDEEVEYLENYLRLEKIRMNGRLETHIEIDPELNLQSTRIPPMLIQPLVENGIKHGASRAEGIGRVHIKFVKTSDNQYQCTVEDNGPGISPGSSSAHISRGLDMIYTRIQLLNEEYGETAFSFTMSNKMQPETGAIMVVELRI